MAATVISWHCQRLSMLLRSTSDCVGNVVRDNRENVSSCSVRTDKHRLLMTGSDFIEVFLMLSSSWLSLFQESRDHCVLRLSTCLLETKHKAFAISSHSWRGPCLTPTKPFRIDSLILNNNENEMKLCLPIPKNLNNPSKTPISSCHSFPQNFNVSSTRG